jgi:hypothetical protein
MGMRTTDATELRNMDIVAFVAMSTAIVAMPSVKPFTTVVVTASSGHNPSS